MPSHKDEALINLAESLVNNGDPERAERAVRSIEDTYLRDYGLMCLARHIATVSLRVDNRRYARRLMKMARRIAQSIETSSVKAEAMAHVEAAGEI